MDPRLLELIACPADHGDLTLVDGALVCATCSATYEIVDGIAVLLPAGE